MNCKPGDLAIVVGGSLPNGGAAIRCGFLPPDVAWNLATYVMRLCLGRLVRVTRLRGDGCTWEFEEPIRLGPLSGTFPNGQEFVTEEAIVDAMADRFLRPLPKLDEDDEILTERPRDEVPA